MLVNIVFVPVCNALIFQYTALILYENIYVFRYLEIKDLYSLKTQTNINISVPDSTLNYSVSSKIAVFNNKQHDEFSRVENNTQKRFNNSLVIIDE
jgi:hypothetical protein